MSKVRDVACDRCFQDPELVAWIRQQGKVGSCPWCGARRAYTVPLHELGPLSREVAHIYVPSDSNHGDTIGYLMQDDWNTFSDRIERDPDLRDDLATSILKAGLHPKDDQDEQLGELLRGVRPEPERHQREDYDDRGRPTREQH